ncbi:MAG: hypothetical protein KDE34_03230 [Anaerolineales bacterium]|nr:hypothetical protein [Anaerolineales bacterium]
MKQNLSPFELVLPWLVLVVLLVYTVGRFAWAPYGGFTFDQAGVVLEVFEPGRNGDLRPGDRLLQIGELSWGEYQRDQGRLLFEAVTAGTPVPLQLEREQRLIETTWRYPGFRWAELLQRLNSEWWLPFVFWLAGLTTLYLIRPRTTLRRLLLGFHFLTAIWLAAGSVSAWHIGQSIAVFHTALWLSIPVYWALHFSFPRPLFRAPGWLLPVLSGVAFILAGLDLFALLPAVALPLGATALFLGSVLLLGLHLFRPSQRPEARWLLLALLVSLAPALAMSVAWTLGAPPVFQGGALLGIVTIPGIYFFAAYQTQLQALQAPVRRLVTVLAGILGLLTLATLLLSFGVDWLNLDTSTFGWGLVIAFFSLNLAVLGFGAVFAVPALAGAYVYRGESPATQQLELIANRYFAATLFVVLLLPLAFVSTSLILVFLTEPVTRLFLLALNWLLAVIIPLLSYVPFKRVVEQRLFGLPVLPATITETYVNQLVAQPGRAALVDLLQTEILPALLIRESALWFFGDGLSASLVYAQALPPAVLPTEAELLAWRTPAGPEDESDTPPLRPWVRLLVPLRLQDRQVGVWLLGRRDPDNLYARQELPMLRALAAQTAAALANFAQTERLQAVYEANIDRNEEERRWLGHELHDVTLSQLGVMSMYLDGAVPEQLLALHGEITRHLRQIVAGLRPIMLEYGLWTGLNQLVDDLMERLPHETEILFDLPQVSWRYGEKVELAVFRILQLAIENALRHSQAELVRVYGQLSAQQIELIVEDNGVGIPPEKLQAKPRADSEYHFGLEMMKERAALIGARLHIASTVGEGTRVTLSWQAPPTW